jgi:hypothetical protein
MTAAQHNDIKTQLHHEGVLYAQLTHQLRNLNPQSREAQDRLENLSDSVTTIRYLELFLGLA